MQYHVLTTERCNLSCSYCGGTRIIEGIPLDKDYSISDLKRFIAMDPDPVIGFYGGEPLLAIDRICEIMDAIPAKAFTLQTNGTLLDLLDKGHLKRLHSILTGRPSTIGCGSGIRTAVFSILAPLYSLSRFHKLKCTSDTDLHKGGLV
jgi:hypothetical protein